MSDKPTKTIITDECVYEEFHSSDMDSWERSLRSLFHLQASPDAFCTPPPECTRQACYEAGQINSCECNFCLPPQQEESE